MRFSVSCWHTRIGTFVQEYELYGTKHALLIYQKLVQERRKGLFCWYVAMWQREVHRIFKHGQEF